MPELKVPLFPDRPWALKRSYFCLPLHVLCSQVPRFLLTFPRPLDRYSQLFQQKFVKWPSVFPLQPGTNVPSGSRNQDDQIAFCGLDCSNSRIEFTFPSPHCTAPSWWCHTALCQLFSWKYSSWSLMKPVKTMVIPVNVLQKEEILWSI